MSPKRFPPGAPRIRELLPVGFERVQIAPYGETQRYANCLSNLDTLLLTIWPAPGLYLTMVSIGTHHLSQGFFELATLRFGLVWKLPPTIKMWAGVGAGLGVANKSRDPAVLEAVIWGRPLP